jgi:hypothetical protein
MTDSTPFACDLRHAPDSVEQRLAAYRQLFSALVGRDAWDRGFRFRFDGERVDGALLTDLVALEQACCPFLRSRVTSTQTEAWWECTVDEPDAMPFLDALRDLPDTVAARPEGHDTVLPGVRILTRDS